MNIFKILLSFSNILGDVKSLKNPDGSLNLQAIEKLLDDAITDAEVFAPKDTELFEKIKVAVNSVIDVIITEEAAKANP